MAKRERGIKGLLNKQRLLVLSGYFANLSATWTAVILVSPGFGAVQSFDDLIMLLTRNLPWSILSLLLAIWLADKTK